MQSSTASLIPCLIESLQFPDESIGRNPANVHIKERKIADLEFYDHEKKWAAMCEEISFSSALRYLRTRMFVDKDMAVVLDESYLRHFALALYRYRSGDIDQSNQDREFTSSVFEWDGTVFDELSISPVIPE
jgi:hypothetical protein